MMKQNTKSANVKIKLICLLNFRDLFLAKGQSPSKFLNTFIKKDQILWLDK
jgi:hypothetical protein